MEGQHSVLGLPPIEERLNTLEMTFGFLMSQNLMVQTQTGNLNLVQLDIQAKVVSLTNQLQELEKWNEELQDKLNALEMVATTPTLVLASARAESEHSGFVLPIAKKRARKSRAKKVVFASSIPLDLNPATSGNIMDMQNMEEPRKDSTNSPDDVLESNVEPLAAEGIPDLEITSPSRSLTTVDSIISLVSSTSLSGAGMTDNAVVTLGGAAAGNGEILVKSKRARVSKKGGQSQSPMKNGPSQSKRPRSRAGFSAENIFQFPDIKVYSSGSNEMGSCEEVEKFRCQTCRSNYGSEEELAAHTELHALISETGSGKKMHPCKVCGREFKTAYHLKSHQVIHANSSAEEAVGPETVALQMD